MVVLRVIVKTSSVAYFEDADRDEFAAPTTEFFLEARGSKVVDFRVAYISCTSKSVRHLLFISYISQMALLRDPCFSWKDNFGVRITLTTDSGKSLKLQIFFIVFFFTYMQLGLCHVVHNSTFSTYGKKKNRIDFLFTFSTLALSKMLA